MEKILLVEAELRQMEVIYARKRCALAKLEDAYRRKLVELLEAKAERDRWIADQSVGPSSNRVGEMADMPIGATARRTDVC
ncbi:hypothetical protein [Bradyrhizobium sp. Tv2a-2]|uniref:hypothetical protein n=1 Tax=Bradyrhizobium sp. Tv2a-2 TaxID=113395 RepID=UPI00042083E7|nr:hypothetical protein [Bradyrhizobium sp. Tv2a-2]